MNTANYKDVLDVTTKAAMYPCKDCKERVPGKCYSTCMRYKKARIRHIDMKHYVQSGNKCKF